MAEQRPSTAPDRSYERSNRLQERALELIPGGSQTGSKSPAQLVQGASPTHMVRGAGSHTWDPDDNEYIDYGMALGPIVLGYDYPDVVDAVKRQLDAGTAFSLPHPLQVDVAERVVEHVPCAEMVRFGKNGNDMTALAAKLARAHTDRDVIATQGYHGWPDVWMSATGLDRGIPKAIGAYTERFDYGDVEALEGIFRSHPDDVAAIVLAIPPTAAESDFLETARELADEHGALLVFDEILTGFRLAVGGAQEYYGVEPDLAVFAKGISNGYPLSALAGRADVMKTLEAGDVFFSMTYAGEAVSLAAAKACLDVIADENVPDHLHRQGRTLRDGYNELSADHGLSNVTELSGIGPQLTASFDATDDVEGVLSRSLFMQEAFKRGVFTRGSHLLCYSHTDEDIEETLAIYDEVLGVLADAHESGDVEDRLEGSRVGATLRQTLGDED